eukprot:5411624-Heterocapsa_arctica.AAC.1
MRSNTLGTATQAAMNKQGTPDLAAAPQRHGLPRNALTTAPPSSVARPGRGADPRSINGADTLRRLGAPLPPQPQPLAPPAHAP